MRVQCVRLWDGGSKVDVLKRGLELWHAQEVVRACLHRNDAAEGDVGLLIPVKHGEIDRTMTLVGNGQRASPGLGCLGLVPL